MEVLRTSSPATAGSRGEPGDTAAAARDSGEPTVTTRILAQYFVTPEVKPWNVDVTSASDGVVTLEGEVDSAETRQQAERVARGIEGVTDVDNRLRVRGESRGQVGTSGRDTVAGTVSDAWLTTKVQAKFFLEDEVKGRDIDVTTESGVVTLSGDVRSANERRRAVALARNIDGVRDVRDKLRVSAAEAEGETRRPAAERRIEAARDRVDDGWITTKVQAQYFRERDIKGRNINVTTRDGVVTLEGTVQSDGEKRMAEEMARDTDGVDRVINRLRIESGA